VASPCEHDIEPSGSIKGGEFLDLLSDCQLLKMECVLCGYLVYFEVNNLMAITYTSYFYYQIQ